ncbi:phosphopantetheine-binding protein [Nitrosomonas sp. Is79A3]|uniref:phosphopantetheine-binding protein n=1 Tax=Nitrosomonas sp. (strain Is79A3) TaxID=261292 RepID=UPI0002FF79AB
MSNKKTTALVKEIISKALKCDKRRIFVKTGLVNDLGADSMKILEIIIAIERELNIEIDDERIGDVFGELKARDLIDAANSVMKVKNRRDYSRIKPTASNNLVALNHENF